MDARVQILVDDFQAGLLRVEDAFMHGGASELTELAASAFRQVESNRHDFSPDLLSQQNGGSPKAESAFRPLVFTRTANGIHMDGALIPS
jgi:hypothetical protein